MLETAIVLSPISRLKFFFQLRDRRRTSDLLSDFGIAIKILMERYNNHHEEQMTDERLASLLPVAKSNMSLFLNGKRVSHHTLTEKMCDILKCSFTEKVHVMRLIHQSPERWYKEAHQQLEMGCQMYIDLNESMIRSMEIGGGIERITGPLPALVQDGDHTILFTTHFPPVTVREEPITEPLLEHVQQQCEEPITEPLLEHVQQTPTATSYTSTCERSRPAFTSSSSAMLASEETQERLSS